MSKVNLAEAAAAKTGYTEFVTREGEPVGETCEFSFEKPIIGRLSCGLWRAKNLDWLSAMVADESLYIISGSLTIYLNGGEPVVLSEGEMMLLPAGSSCRCVADAAMTAFFALNAPV